MQADQKFIINIDENPESALNLAAELFHSGKIFIYPTDTIYGIGGNPFDENVVKRISDIKGRNEKKQFIWLLSDFENLMNYVVASPMGEAISGMTRRRLLCHFVPHNDK